ESVLGAVRRDQLGTIRLNPHRGREWPGGKLYGQDPGLVGAERPGDPSLATGDGLLDDWGHQWGSIQEDAEAPAHQLGGDFRKELGTFRIQPKQDLRAVRGRLEGELGVQEVLPGERHHTAVSPTAGRDDPFALAFNDPLF